MIEETMLLLAPELTFSASTAATTLTFVKDKEYCTTGIVLRERD